MTLDTTTMTSEHLREAGTHVLEEAFGPLGAVRFLQLAGFGTGNYTEERHAWLDGLTVEEIMSDIEKMRGEKLT